MTPEEQLRLDLQNMILEVAGKDEAAVKEQPMAFALAVCEVAHAMGVTAGIQQARDQIAAYFGNRDKAST